MSTYVYAAELELYVVMQIALKDGKLFFNNLILIFSKLDFCIICFYFNLYYYTYIIIYISFSLKFILKIYSFLKIGML